MTKGGATPPNALAREGQGRSSLVLVVVLLLEVLPLMD